MTGRSAVTRPPGESSQPSSPCRTGSRLAMATTVTLLLTYLTLTGQTTAGLACPQGQAPATGPDLGQGDALGVTEPAGLGDVLGETGGLVAGDGEEVVGVTDTVGVGDGDADVTVGVGVAE